MGYNKMILLLWSILLVSLAILGIMIYLTVKAEKKEKFTGGCTKTSDCGSKDGFGRYSQVCGIKGKPGQCSEAKNLVGFNNGIVCSWNCDEGVTHTMADTNSQCKVKPVGLTNCKLGVPGLLTPPPYYEEQE